MAEGKCPPCKQGAPGWMATFSDMCTLLLTFFILLLSFAKTETAKYEAAMGSIRNAFGGNSLKVGEVLRLGKSPDDAATMIESERPPQPFPIEFLTSEGLLDKHEINRQSDEQLSQMKKMLKDYNLSQEADVYEMPEAIYVRLKDRIFFKEGSVEVEGINIQVFERLIKLLRENNWHIMVEGHAAKDEQSSSGEDAFKLSSNRALAVSKSLMKRGVSQERVSIVFYGDSRPAKEKARSKNSRVEFMIRKFDLRQKGHKVPSQ